LNIIYFVIKDIEDF